MLQGSKQILLVMDTRNSLIIGLPQPDPHWHNRVRTSSKLTNHFWRVVDEVHTPTIKKFRFKYCPQAAQLAQCTNALV